MPDLFGEDVKQISGPKGGKHYVRPSGYVAMPGTGPTEETCGTCQHLRKFRRWFKCGLNQAKWTGGRKTDVLSSAPACAKWESKDLMER